MTAINASRDTLNKSDLPAFLYKCDKTTCVSNYAVPSDTYVGRTLPYFSVCFKLQNHSKVNSLRVQPGLGIL